MSNMNLPRVKLVVGEHSLNVYVARTAEERALGLMFRTRMEPDEGMLFMNDRPAPQKFWMKDTPLPLSIAFLSDDGSILQLDDMDPQTQDTHSCEHPVRFVLEVNRGWFDAHGVRTGAKLEGPPFLAAELQ